MKKSCKYCGRIHGINEACPVKPRRTKKRTSQSDIRSRYSWTKKSLEIRERDVFLCRLCLTSGRINYTDVGVHHIIPLGEDESFAFDDDWLISLCAVHHKQADAGEINRQLLHDMACAPIPPIPAPRAGMMVQDHSGSLGHKIFRK